MKNIKLTEEECIKVLKHICTMLNAEFTSPNDMRKFNLETSPNYSIQLGHATFWNPKCPSAYEYFYHVIKYYLPTSMFLQTIMYRTSVEEILIEADLNA